MDLICTVLSSLLETILSFLPRQLERKEKIQQTQYISVRSLPCSWITAYPEACLLPLSKVWTVSLLQGLLWHIHTGHSTDKFMGV